MSVTKQRFFLTVNGVITEGNYCQIIRELLIKHDVSGWNLRTKEKTLSANLHPTVDLVSSAWPINTCKDAIFNKSAYTLNKLLTGLPTRHVVAANPLDWLKNTKYKSKWWKTKFMTKYSTNKCIKCKVNVENTEHVFRCVKNGKLWRKAKHKIVKVLKCYDPTVTVPKIRWWFGNDLRRPFTGRLSHLLLGFNKEWGSKGAIPTNLTRYLAKVVHVGQDHLNEVVLSISQIITMTMFKIWISRCHFMDLWAQMKLMTYKQNMSNSVKQN